MHTLQSFLGRGLFSERNSGAGERRSGSLPYNLANRRTPATRFLDEFARRANQSQRRYRPGRDQWFGQRLCRQHNQRTHRHQRLFRFRQRQLRPGILPLDAMPRGRYSKQWRTSDGRTRARFPDSRRLRYSKQRPGLLLQLHGSAGRQRSRGLPDRMAGRYSKPVVSTLNDLTGTIVANAAIVPAGTENTTAVYPSNTTNLLIDVNGYFAPASSAANPYRSTL